MKLIIKFKLSLYAYSSPSLGLKYQHACVLVNL